MKKFFIMVAVICSLLALLTGCSDAEIVGDNRLEQTLARDFGGTTIINLEPNLKLEEITSDDQSIL